MRNLTLSGLALLGAAHCSDPAAPDASPPDVTDAAPDATPDVASDATPDAMDIGPDVAPDASPDAMDAAPDVTPDIKPDAAPPDGDVPRCESAGGRCAPLVPMACADGVTGNAAWYSCGGGLGVVCCLPATTPPACRAVGTRSEGWYRANGERICFARCEGAGVTCANVGTRSEGWYTDVATAACGDPPVERLVQWTRCAP